MKTGIEFIAEERNRQIEKEGFESHHDDLSDNNELACAAAVYAMPDQFSDLPISYIMDFKSDMWPWDKEWWRPSPDNRIKELAKAGALIAAEIDRLQRLENSK